MGDRNRYSWQKRNIENFRSTLETISGIFIFQMRKLSLRETKLFQQSLAAVSLCPPPPPQSIFAAPHTYKPVLPSRARESCAVWPLLWAGSCVATGSRQGGYFRIPSVCLRHSMGQKPQCWLFCCSCGFGPPALPQSFFCPGCALSPGASMTPGTQ